MTTSYTEEKGGPATSLNTLHPSQNTAGCQAGSSVAPRMTSLSVPPVHPSAHALPLTALLPGAGRRGGASWRDARRLQTGPPHRLIVLAQQKVNLLHFPGSRRGIDLERLVPG